MTGKAYRSLTFKTAKSEGTEFRTAELNDQEHLIVPVIAIVEGVLWASNSPQPELALASEFGKFPAAWDGRPILLGHPKNAAGEGVSANSPDVWDTVVLGQMFGTVLDGKKLKAEMWINTERADKDLVTRMQEGVVEVSTGLFTETESKTGIYNGEEYKGIWRNIMPDHLAILPEGVTGACSVEDGCGAPRNNKAKGARTMPCNCTKQTFQALMASAVPFTSELRGGERSDVTTRDALATALSSVDKDAWFYVAAVYEDHFVYGQYDPESGTVKTFDRGYSIKADGTVILAKDITEVRAETSYVPVSVSVQQGNQPKGAEMSNQPNQAAQEAQRQAEAAQAEADKKSLASIKENAEKARAWLKANVDKGEEAIAGKTDVEVIILEAYHRGVGTRKPAENQQQQQPSEKTAEQKAADEIARRNAEAAAQPAARALAYYEQRKANLVKALSGKTAMTDDELKSLEPAMLEKLAATFGGKVAEEAAVNFAGAAPNNLSQQQGQDKEPNYTPPALAFPPKKAA